MSNFVVHAEWRTGKIVRQPSSRKWYHEPAHGRRRALSVKEAAALAVKEIRAAWRSREWPPSHACVYWGRKGGSIFERLAEEMCSWLRPPEFKTVEFEGRQMMIAECPNCREWMEVNSAQKDGGTCMWHARSDGGCGFHGYVIGYHAGYIPDPGDPSRTKRGVAA